MPRRRKDEQAPAAAPGQPYGENLDQIQAQNVIPLPNVANASAAGPPMPTGAPPGAGDTGLPPGDPNADPMAAAMAAALATPPPTGGLFAPSTKPGEPITAGMATGMGPGPEAMGPNRAFMKTAADTYRMLADITGNPMYIQMAQEAGEQGI